MTKPTTLDLSQILAVAIENSDHDYHHLLCAVITHGTNENTRVFCDHWRRYHRSKLVPKLYALCKAKVDTRISRVVVMPILRAKLSACIPCARPANYIDFGSGLLADCTAELCRAHYVCKVDFVGCPGVQHVTNFTEVDPLWCKANGLPVKWDLISCFSAHCMPLAELFQTFELLLAKKGQLILRAFDVQDDVDKYRTLGLLIATWCNRKTTETIEEFSSGLTALAQSAHLTSQVELLKTAESRGWRVVGKPCVWSHTTREYVVLLER